MADWKSHIRRAVAIAGTQAKLATEMSRYSSKNYRQSHIWHLLGTADSIAGEDALAVDYATDGKVSAHELRPDLWLSAKHVPPRPTPPQAKRQRERAAS